MTFADEQIVYRDLAGPWGSFKLVVGGVDVTRFRGVPAQIGQYQLTEPYGYGPAEFQFPQVTAFETEEWGTGDLAWLDLGKTVRLVQVDEAGTKVRTVWRGFISQADVSDDGTSIHCDGEASGRLALRDKHDEVFYFTKDAGRLVWEALNKVDLNCTPHLGLETGIEIYERGRSGGTLLDYTDGLLAESQTAAGDQLTVSPDGAGGYVVGWKGRATVDASVDYGAAGVSLSVSRDLQEEPTTFYGHGRDPDGLLWVNAKAPGLVQGSTPAFPGTLSLGDSGEDVRVLQQKLIGMGFLDAEDAVGDMFNADTEDAVIALQDEAELTQTGVVNSATWDALWDLDDTGLSLRQAFIAPLAQLSAVRKNTRTSNGSVSGFNPNHDPDRIEVDRTLDWSVARKKRARRWSKRELSRIHNGPPAWVGTLDLSSDLVAGAHDGTTTPAALLSRLDVTAGMNVRVDNFHGDTLFHVAAVNVSSDLRVSCLIDTKARDAMTLAQILERNRLSRIKPARTFLQERRTGPNSKIVEFSEIGGRIWNTINCPAEQWTVFPVIAGQSGSVNQIRVKVEDSACEYAVAASAKRTGRGWWNALSSNPLAEENAWNDAGLQEKADDERAILGIWGDFYQPCGYYPGTKTDDTGEPSGDPLTGIMLDQGGFDYHTFEQPVIWVAVWPRQACKIKPQRILWPVLEAGM